MGTEEKKTTRDLDESGDKSDEVSKTKVKVGSKFFEEFYVSVGVHQGPVLPLCSLQLW